MSGLAEAFWNDVTLGDGRKARLVGVTSWNRIVNDDGSFHCNHGDSTDCARQGHETIVLYEVVLERESDETDTEYIAMARWRDAAKRRAKSRG